MEEGKEGRIERVVVGAACRTADSALAAWGLLTLTSKKAEPNVCHWWMVLRNPTLASAGERLWWRVK